MRRADPSHAPSGEPILAAENLTLVELLTELGKRLGVAYGRVEVTFHDRVPVPRIVVEHRLHKTVADS